jgi:hypothetical protein
MIKTIATSCLLAAAMTVNALAGDAAPSGKAPVVAPTPAPECPATPSYSYATLSWVRGMPDVGDDLNGANLDLSYGIANNFYVRGSASWTDGLDWDYTAGAGAYIPLQENLHLAVEAGGLFATDDGWYVQPHLRGKFGCFELWAGAKYLKFKDFDGFWEGHVNAFYQVAQNTDIAVGGIFGEDAQALMVGLRRRF